MRRVLAFSAIVEVGTGITLIIRPAFVLELLAGGEAYDASLPLGRCFGIAILALVWACWPERTRAESGSPAFRGLLTYNTFGCALPCFLGRCRAVEGIVLVAGSRAAHRRGAVAGLDVARRAMDDSTERVLSVRSIMPERSRLMPSCDQVPCGRRCQCQDGDHDRQANQSSECRILSSLTPPLGFKGIEITAHAGTERRLLDFADARE